MASPSRPPGTPSNCAQAVALAAYQDDEQVLSRPDEARPATPDYDFVEHPLQDFFCPITMELLMEPQLTSCCGHHLSAEASARLQREGKVCPMCNEQQWTAALDKYHRRRVREIHVRCPHKRSGCDWEGEVGGFERHATSCPKRPWECPHCTLKCTYGEGEGKHWPVCSKFPEPCPNGCEVGSVERCHLEQHHRECPLEPVACEMREFGCSAVVPRKDLASHMRDSELQHLTAMAVINLRLTRQLQQDLVDKDEKIAHLQLEMTKHKEELKEKMTMQNEKLKKEMTQQKEELKKEVIEQKEELKKEMTEQMEVLKKNMTEQKEELKEEMTEQNEELKKEMTEQKEELKKEMTELKEELKKEMTEQKEELKKEMAEQKEELKKEMTEHKDLQMKISQELKDELKRGIIKQNKELKMLCISARHIEMHASCDVCKVFIFDKYGVKKENRSTRELGFYLNVGVLNKAYSDAFYSNEHGYKFKLEVSYLHNEIKASVCPETGEYDDQLPWPVKVKVNLELLNQAGDHHHVVRNTTSVQKKELRGKISIGASLMQYADLEKRGDGVQYMMNDCLQFRLHLTVQAA